MSEQEPPPIPEQELEQEPQPLTMLIGGAAQQQLRMDASMANRHGMIAGATGTGKTITMQIMAEEFSKVGAPVLYR